MVPVDISPNHLFSMPSILPEEQKIVAMTVDQIEEMISKYSGMSTEQIHDKLLPGNSSMAGFLKVGSCLYRDYGLRNVSIQLGK